MTTDWASDFSGDISNIHFFPHNMSTPFRRASKKAKVSSRNRSPRDSLRRRMTTNLPARTRSVSNQQPPVFDTREGVYRNVNAPRPISWHPISLNGFHQHIDSQLPPNMYSNINNTAFAYGLITPDAFPQLDPRNVNCPDVPLEQMTSQDFSYDHFTRFATDVTQYEPHGSNFDRAPILAQVQDMADSQVQTTAWAPRPFSTTPDIATAPPSPDLLPMPNFGEPFKATQLERDNAKEDLVALGLYDSPAEIQSSNLLFGGSLSVRRKSLKLEESFEPKPPSETSNVDAESEPDPEQFGVDRSSVPTALGMLETTPISDSVVQYYNYIQTQPCYGLSLGDPGYTTSNTPCGFF